MARSSRKTAATRPLASARGAGPETDAAFGTSRALARNRSHRRLVKNRRRIHRRALCAGRTARRRPLCPRAAASFALRTRTNLQVRNPAKTKTTLRRQNHPRRPFPRWLSRYCDEFILTKGCRVLFVALNLPSTKLAVAYSPREFEQLRTSYITLH